jgi:thiol-disulfide isomerase/thioredoxin
LDGEKKSKADLAKKTDSLKTLGKSITGIEIEVYLATWCGDSHDHVPTFTAVLDEVKRVARVEPKSVKYYGLSKKKTYDGYTNPRSIDRLPTFVFFRNGKEIGRIIETPKKSILEDVIGIVSEK